MTFTPSRAMVVERDVRLTVRSSRHRSMFRKGSWDSGLGEGTDASEEKGNNG